MRDSKIDFIRALCTVLVILPHIGAPASVNHIRTFDVIALVMASGMSLSIGNITDYSSYYVKRIKRLLIPTYIALIFIFGLTFLFAYAFHVKTPYTYDKILFSFLLFSKGSMGYVWIVRIYLICALLTPLILKLVDSIREFRYFHISILLSTVGSYAIYRCGIMISNPLLQNIFFDYIYSGVVYSIILFIGVWTYRNKQNYVLITATTAGYFMVYHLFLSYLGIINGFEANSFKFPPQLYYCLYGCLVSLVLYYIFPSKRIGVLEWMSINSFSIYLWHIFVLRFCGIVGRLPGCGILRTNWVVRFSFVLILSIVFSYLWIEKIKPKVVKYYG